MDVTFENGSAVIHGVSCFNVELSCNCGQAFRWHSCGDGFAGAAGDRAAVISLCADALRISPCAEEDIGFWTEYFDLDRDYASIEARIAGDERIAACLAQARGIRVFRQQPFETLISFIISANNNIKRISGSIERICALAGQPARGAEELKLNAFPCAERVAALTERELTDCGVGYRAPYIIKTAKAVAEGFDLDALRAMPYESARKSLMSLMGVGPKVADCVLLFSLGHTEAFPMDVWMKRAVRVLLMGGQDADARQIAAAVESLGAEAGIIQQYIFHYARMENIK